MSCLFLATLVSLLCSGPAAAIKCYYCDNAESAACGQDFKAYQFEAIACREDNGVKAKCGKQEQPPDGNGWIGVIRSCYYPGDLPGINETNGCHHYFHDQNNFTALYCFCDSAYCNQATPLPPISSLIVVLWAVLLSTISALLSSSA